MSTSSPANALERDTALPPTPVPTPQVQPETPSILNLPSTQTTRSVASMLSTTASISTGCPPLDKLLRASGGGGAGGEGSLPRGHILEISGPPGSPKESIAVGIVVSFLKAQAIGKGKGKGHEEEVVFVDCQNMTSPATLAKALHKRRTSIPDDYMSLISHINVNTLPDLMIFIHNLPELLKSCPRTSLLVLNSVAFPFQSPPTTQPLTPASKSALLERMKQALIKACVSSVTNLTVVTTSQLSTKLLNADGSAGNFDTGSRAVMVPQLGPTYLPSGRTYRVLIVPNSRTSGFIRLLSAPASGGTNFRVKEEEYSIATLGEHR